MRGPAFAAVAVAALLTLVIVQPTPEVSKPLAVPLAKIDNSARLDSMQSSVDSVALVTEAETNTTLLWIMDDAAGAVEHAGGDAWDSLE